MLRIHKQRTRVFLIDALEASPSVADIPDEWEDMIFVQMAGGAEVIIYLYDRHLDFDDLEQIFIENTRRGVHSLFILSAAMLLPEHNEHYHAEDWMAALATLYGGKIYSYRVMRTLVDICPIAFTSDGNGAFHVEYGEKVNVAGLRTLRVTIGGDTYLIADFEQDVADVVPDVPFVAGTQSFMPPQRMQPDFTSTDPYLVLGLSTSADRPTIKAVFRELARRYHPDVDQSPGAKVRMQALNNAYRELMSRPGA